jgi:Zn ribbon nucleic-acid-binding protein
MRICVNCGHRLRSGDLLENQSWDMEEARVSAGLERVCFRYYTCPQCGHDHVFLEVAPTPKETPEHFRARREALAQAAQDIQRAQTSILVVEQGV